MPFLDNSKVKLYYELHGQGDLLVLIPGYTCDLHMWDELLPLLKNHFSVLIFDNRGAGQTTTVEKKWSIDDMAKDVLELIRHISPSTSYSLLGHSMGGAIAQKVAILDSKKIRKLILSNTTAGFTNYALRLFLFFLNLRKQGIPDAMLNEGILPLLFSESFLEDQKKIDSYLQECSKNLFPQTIDGQSQQLIALSSFNTKNLLSSINCPSLIIASDKDKVTFLDESQFLHEHIKNSFLHLFHNVGHIPFGEKLEEFAEVTLNFLKK